MKNKTWKIVIVFLLGIFFLLQYKLWFQADGVLQMLKLKKILAEKHEENERIRHENKRLLFQIERSQQSQDATEAHARNDLGMIKKSETFYQIVR